MKIFRATLRKINTHLLVIDAMENLLSAFHFKKRAKYREPLLGDKKKIRTVKQVFLQQVELGAGTFMRGLISRNWNIAQNVCHGTKSPQKIDENWVKKVIRAVWIFSQSMWTARCKEVHMKSKNDPTNFTHQELLFSLRQMLRTPRNELSSAEKMLHLNVVRHLNTAHTTTLVKWLKLISKEREMTIRAKRESRRTSGRLQLITRFFHPT